MARRFTRLNRRQIRIGFPAALLLVAALWGYSALPVAWGNPELHRGWEQPALLLVNLGSLANNWAGAATDVTSGRDTAQSW